MLQQLSIRNFALIDDLKVTFNEGFSTITGETGAGKSIILGGLSLILGKRADLSVLKDESKKCIIEGEFSLANYDLLAFFRDNDIDYDEVTIIRREISPSGKSRAFVNDTPVKLNVLNELGVKLIDIHSQHQTLQLSDVKYQFNIIDALAKNSNILNEYSLNLEKYNTSKNELELLLKEQQEANLQYDYNLFLFNELNDANLIAEEQIKLEDTLEKLNNVEEIKLNFEEAIAIANNDELGVKNVLNSFKANLTKLASFSEDYKELSSRTISLDIEFADIVDELERTNENITASPDEIASYNDRLKLIYDLQKKHGVNSNEELLQIHQDLSVKVNNVENANEILNDKKSELIQIEKTLDVIANKLYDRRKDVIPGLIQKLEVLLAELSMPNTRFDIRLIKSDKFFKNGKDELQFLFSANKGSNFESLKKVASGGEMSRIMLAVKYLLGEHTNLPTILFDEIDTGVSGEVSNRIASIMKKMSDNMQVIAITHLPQIASKGNCHYKVFKEDIDNKTVTNIKELNKEERVNEIAEMLGGKVIVDSAVKHAKQLLG